MARVKVLPSARDRQVRRALAAERRRRTVDEEVAAIRRWVKRGIPVVAALNVATIGVLIWQGMAYAIAGNLVVLPLLWLSRWLLIVAEARDFRRDTHREMVETASDAIIGTTDRRFVQGVGPSPQHEAPRDCIFIIGDPDCQVCGERDPSAMPRWTPDPPDDDIPF